MSKCSLSKCIYGIAAYDLGHHEQGYEYFKAVTQFDLKDAKKFTRYGLHAANLGGSYLMLIYGLFGVRMGKTLSINPPYQTEIKQAKAHLFYQGVNIVLSLDEQKLTITTDAPLEFTIYNDVFTVEKTHQFKVQSKPVFKG